MLDDVIALAEDGFSVIWLRPRSKAPLESKWTSLPVMTARELKKTYEKGLNAGVRLGKPSKVLGMYLHVIDMDIRDEKLLVRAKKELKLRLELDSDEFPTVISGSGGESRHFYFLCEEDFSSRKLWHSDDSFVGADGKKHWGAEIDLFGTGKQVALPPSIHPDTGKRYRWAEEFDPQALPIIDPDVLRAAGAQDDDYDIDEDIKEPLGLSFGDAEEALGELKSWADDRDTWRDMGMALKHEFGNDGWPLFDRWSKQGKGYDQAENRAQWKSFQSDRRRPITMRTIMQKAAEVSRMIDADVLRDEFDDEDDEPAPLSRKQILEMFDAPLETPEKPVAGKLRGIPKEILTIPGILGRAVTHYNETAIMDQPQFAVQAALALGSVVCARYWRTKGGVYTSLFLVCLANTAAGKESVRFFLNNAFDQAKLFPIIGPNQYSSEAAVTGDLQFNARHLSIVDEFGKLLGSSKNSSNVNAQDAQTALMSAYGAVNGIIKPKSYSSNGKSAKQIKEEKTRVIRRPAITMVGLSTPDTFYDVLGTDDVASGFMNRLLIVNSRMPRQPKNKIQDKKIPTSLKNWMQDYALPEELQGYFESEFDKEDDTSNSMGEDASNPPDATVVPMSAAAEDRLYDIDRYYIAQMDRLDSDRLSGLLGRGHEMTIRIALIVALSMDRRKPRIEVEDVEWAHKYVSFYLNETVESARENLGASAAIRVARELADVIEGKGRTGMTIREMARASTQYRNMDKRGRDEVLAHLQTLDITDVEIKGDNGGRPTIRYMSLEAERELRERASKQPRRNRNHEFA